MTQQHPLTNPPTKRTTMTEQESTCLTEKPLTVEELKELLNHGDLYELLRKSLTSEEQAYIDKIQMDAIYKDT